MRSVMPNESTPRGTSAPAATAPTTITFFKPREKAKGIRKAITSWPKLFELFSKAKPTTITEKNAQAGWSPATFTGDTRKQANVEFVHALVLDYDSGATTPEQALAVWDGHLACVYTSWSHTPSKPKFRLIVPFSRGTINDEYATLWKNAASKVKAAGQEIDEATKDASRLWYLPSRRDDHFRVIVQDGQMLDVNELLKQADTLATDIDADPTATVVPTTPPSSSAPSKSAFIATVKERSRLEDLIHPSAGWDKKSADDWWCSSPLRQGDREPSFHIKLGDQLWFDFGLGEGGDVFAFLQRLWGCDFKTALKRRSKELGITRPIDLDFDSIEGFAVTEHDSQIVSKAEVAASTSMAAEPPKPRFPSTDLGNAERFVFRHGQDVRYVPLWDKWLAWTGKRWQIDDRKRVDRLAQVTVRTIYREAMDEADMDRRKALAEHAKKSEAHARKVALLDHAKSLPGIPIAPTDLDIDPMLLNVKNGTLDLRTGELREHRREDLLTKMAKASFDPTAKCPLYDTFLARVQPDVSVRNLIRQLDGSCLAGVVRDHVFPIHYGSGRNGKGVHTNALLHVLGDYARQVPTELLMAKKGDVHPTEKTTLFGIRFAAAVESEEGRSLNVGFVKQMTGGDRISARRMREDFWEFDPTHKLQLSTNHRPVIRETKDAIWARVVLIPWQVQIPEDEQDKQLGEKLKAEADGILAKLVRQCMEWQRTGLAIPVAVRTATQEYRSDMDVLGEFVSIWCIEDTKSTSGAAHLYSVYKSWAEDGGEYVQSQTAFGRQLGERGFMKERCSRTGRIVWRGLRVRTSDDDAPIITSTAEYREPGQGMSITDVFEEIAAAEQSEQSEPEFGIATHEREILAGTGNLLQTIQTIQPASPNPLFTEVTSTMVGAASMIGSADTDTEPEYDQHTPEERRAYGQYRIELV